MSASPAVQAPLPSLQGAVIAVVADGDEACARSATALSEAGAIVRCASVHVSGLSTLSAPGFDAAVLDVGDDPEAFVALTRALQEDPRTRPLPLLVLISAGVVAARVAGLGLVHVVADPDPGSLVSSLATLVAARRAESLASECVRALEERLRSALDRLSSLRAEAQTVTHDARVLSGIVVGFAANLRDGIAGPIDAMQLEHVGRILEAAKDTTALVERFGATVRAQTDLPPEKGSVPPPGRRANRRTLLDLVLLAQTTLHLFKSMAEQKSVAVDLDAQAPVSAWCDALQVKQIVTNLLVNAIKFTPRGGQVVVTLRSVAPQTTAAGPGARHCAELIVRDTGPGIPREDRERVFERGVRLERDRRLPGSGVGLAVVREMVAAHGGTVQIDEPPGGGASFCVRLPLDMRTRREPSVLLIDDPGVARRIVSALRSRHEGSARLLRSDESGLASALETCRAVVVVPGESRLSLDELLDAAPGEPPEGGDRR